MSSSGRPLSTHQNHKEMDSVKESISDIINQLQDIDPSRLSFSPFLDLDTQISLAPVSDSPESSVEELHSASHSVSGSTRSLEPAPVNSQYKGLPQYNHRLINNNTIPKSPPPSEDTKTEVPNPNSSTPILTALHLDTTTDNRISTPNQGLPNGTDSPRWSPNTTNEAHPLISPPLESVELTLWTSEAPVDVVPEEERQDNVGQGCCCCCQCCFCRCCQSGRIPAFVSVLASFLCVQGIMYALYFHVPLKPPRFNDVTSRIVFTLCCCSLASIPILLAMIVGALCQFCSGALELQDSFPTRRTIQQLFITSSLELLLLYALNLVIMAALIPPEYLKIVPVVTVMFTLGRLVYWVSVNVCSHWRGFGSGLSVFPLLASVALNLQLMYNTINGKQALFGS